LDENAIVKIVLEIDLAEGPDGALAESRIHHRIIRPVVLMALENMCRHGRETKTARIVGHDYRQLGSVSCRAESGR
jgi:hypothetical protein